MKYGREDNCLLVNRNHRVPAPGHSDAEAIRIYAGDNPGHNSRKYILAGTYQCRGTNTEHAWMGIRAVCKVRSGCDECEVMGNTIPLLCGGVMSSH